MLLYVACRINGSNKPLCLAATVKPWTSPKTQCAQTAFILSMYVSVSITILNMLSSSSHLLISSFWNSSLLSRASQSAQEHDWEQHVWRGAWCRGFSQRLRCISGTLTSSYAMHAMHAFTSKTQSGSFICISQKYILAPHCKFPTSAFICESDNVNTLAIGNINKDHLIWGWLTLLDSKWCLFALFQFRK